jgi:alanine racemase
MPTETSASDQVGTAHGRLVVDLDALARNYRKLRDLGAPADCAAVVKANAYGLGADEVAARLAREGCSRFFVATLAEAQRLRSRLRDVSIYVLDGVSDGEADAVAIARATPVLSSLEQIARWRGRGRAALHVDTGITRLGLGRADVEHLAREPQLLEGVDVELVLTHLACADEPEHPLNRDQLRWFAALRARLPAAPTSIGNSAAIALGRELCGDVGRGGIALYGGNPFAERANPFESVVTLLARILQVRTIDEDVTVGYGATYVARARTRVATLGVGYADGYRRRLGNRGVAAIAECRVPVIGRVSMDLTCIDVSGVPPEQVREGDWVELIGPHVPLDDVAAAADTISYEILTGLGSRLRREYVER